MIISTFNEEELIPAIFTNIPLYSFVWRKLPKMGRYRSYNRSHSAHRALSPGPMGHFLTDQPSMSPIREVLACLLKKHNGCEWLSLLIHLRTIDGVLQSGMFLLYLPEYIYDRAITHTPMWSYIAGLCIPRVICKAAPGGFIYISTTGGIHMLHNNVFSAI